MKPGSQRYRMLIEKFRDTPGRGFFCRLVRISRPPPPKARVLTTEELETEMRAFMTRRRIQKMERSLLKSK